MMDQSGKVFHQSLRAKTNRRGKELLLVGILLVGMAAIFLLSRWMDQHRLSEATAARAIDSEQLYIKPEVARRLSLGFNGLVADWYWMRTLQYVGRKMVAFEGKLYLDDLSPLNAKQVAPLLDHVITLDPQFMAAYEFGAMVLPAISVDDAVRFLEKGIEANPQAWRLYHYLGYIYWQQGKFQEASEAYSFGSRIPGAMAWMQAMSAQMKLKGGSRDTARDIYKRMYTESGDEQVKEMALRRLLQVDSLDERDAIRRLLSDYRAQTGRCANSWRELVQALRAANLKIDASGSPLDPTGMPYLLDASTCEAKIHPDSKIPQK